MNWSSFVPRNVKFIKTFFLAHRQKIYELINLENTVNTRIIMYCYQILFIGVMFINHEIINITSCYIPVTQSSIIKPVASSHQDDTCSIF